MNEIYDNLARTDIWRLTSASGETAFGATEVWMRHDTGETEIRTRHIDADENCTAESGNLESWLAESTTREDADRSLLVRLVWMTASRQDRCVKLNQKIQNTLADSFGLDHAYKYFRSSLTGITRLPIIQDRGVQVHPFAFGYAPKLVLLWSQTHFPASVRQRPLIQGIILIEEGKKKSLLKFLQATAWSADLYHCSMFPCLMLAMWLGIQVNGIHAEVVHGVENIERSTGFHDYATLPLAFKNPEGAGRLAVVASGFKGRLASTDRKIAMVDKLLRFILQALDKEDNSQQRNDVTVAESSCRRGRQILRSHVAVLQERAEMQTLDAECAHKRVQIQIDALFSIITQHDSLSNLHQAAATHHIAYSSYRDSSSMRTLAIVTMFFLPGSFVSALFSMPMFEWDKTDKTSTGIGVGVMPQFNLYWAITVPLTVVTFCLYFLWLWFLKRELKNKHEYEPKKGEEVFAEKAFSEAHRLERLRREASG